MLAFSSMERVPHRSCDLAAWVQTVATVVYLSVFSLLSPLLVVCEDGSRHAATELVVARCCQPEESGPGEPEQAPEARARSKSGCAEYCTDTPFLSGIDVLSPRNIAQRSEVLVAAPAVVLAPLADSDLPCVDTGGRLVHSIAVSRRSTVLLI